MPKFYEDLQMEDMNPKIPKKGHTLYFNERLKTKNDSGKEESIAYLSDIKEKKFSSDFNVDSEIKLSEIYKNELESRIEKKILNESIFPIEIDGVPIKSAFIGDIKKGKVILKYELPKGFDIIVNIDVLIGISKFHVNKIEQYGKVELGEELVFDKSIPIKIIFTFRSLRTDIVLHLLEAKTKIYFGKDEKDDFSQIFLSDSEDFEEGRVYQTKESLEKYLWIAVEKSIESRNLKIFNTETGIQIPLKKGINIKVKREGNLNFHYNCFRSAQPVNSPVRFEVRHGR